VIPFALLDLPAAIAIAVPSWYGHQFTIGPQVYTGFAEDGNGLFFESWRNINEAHLYPHDINVFNFKRFCFERRSATISPYRICRLSRAARELRYMEVSGTRKQGYQNIPPEGRRN